MTEIGSASPAFPPARIARPPDELRRILGVLLVLVGGILICGAGGVLIHQRSNALTIATTNTAGVARLLDEHMTRTLGTTDILLRRMAQVVMDHRQGRLTDAQQDEAMAELQSGLPERGGIVVLDETGIVVQARTPSGPIPANPYLDRTWFQAHLAGADLVIGPMVRSKITNLLLFTVSRRLRTPDGRFAGAIACGIYVPSFTSFHDTMVLGHQGFISAAVGSTLMLRQPDPDTFLGRTLDSTGLMTAVKEHPVGSLVSRRTFDGIERIISYRRLKDYPDVMVIAGAAIDEVLKPWWGAVWETAVALLLAIAAVGGLATMAFRGIRREQLILDGLELRVAERTREAEARAREADSANESKTRFLAAASHDLRQPLQAAGMFVEVLAARTPDPRQMEVIDKLRRSIEATNSLLTTLLDVSALEAGRITPNVTTFRLMPLLAGLVDQIEPEATQRGLSIGAVPTDARVYSDPVLLERLLRNLVVNAVRHTVQGGVLIGCRRRGADRVAIEVWDSGIGIPADKLDTVFEDFIRLEDAAVPPGERGLGLGLGVVRRMAMLLGHQLDVRSRSGRGSCFGVVVPRG